LTFRPRGRATPGAEAQSKPSKKGAPKEDASMHKVMALYPQPKDPAHFKRYYVEKHLPLAAQMPGLLYSRHTFSVEGVGGPAPFFCIWEGAFPSAASMDAAMQTPIGQQVAADIANYATGGVTLVHYDTEVHYDTDAHRDVEAPTPAAHSAASAASATAGAAPEGEKDRSREIAADRFAAGVQLRREMLGPALGDRALETATDFNRPLQEIVTRYCFGEVWTRPLLDRRTRSMLTIALLVALGKPTQLRAHVRVGIHNGLSKDEIREVLLHSMIYCGVPAGVDSFTHAADVLKEMGLD
jgi:4-carboxymuconolactone decarboxylase